jgi:hypothetical protein
MRRLFGIVFLFSAALFGELGYLAWQNRSELIVSGNYHVLFLVAASICLLSGIVLFSRRHRYIDPVVKGSSKTDVKGPDKPAAEDLASRNKAA